MEFIDAAWDTRSLRTPCAEIEFSVNDDAGAVNDALSKALSFDYVAAKVPVGNVQVARLIQEQGFRYIEESIELTIELTNVHVSPMVARFERAISSTQAEGLQIEDILDHVRDGMFDTDRVYLDLAFGPKLAAGRYVNWIRDELRRGATLHQVMYKDNPVGFYIYKERVPGVEAYPFLAGIYNKWKSRGIGTNVVCLEPLREAQRRGCERIKTYVSSNNMPILRIHEELGYAITGMSTVFVRHGEGMSNHE